MKILPQTLGYLGLLPFVLLSALIAFGSDAHVSFFALAQLGYGAVILSFLGGVIWGRVLADSQTPRTRELIYSVLPSLVGWVALLFPGRVGFALLAAGFVGALAVDYALGSRKLLPRWYVGMRWVLTLVVVSAMILSAYHYQA